MGKGGKDVLEETSVVALEVHLCNVWLFKYWQIASGQYGKILS